ncbi:MAG: hypothetical protein ACOYOK_08330 [Pseudobdellovibrionaceae bacterium]
MILSPRQRYKKTNGISILEVKVRSVGQLFDSRDPAPFRDRDLDDDFTDYIVSSVEEMNHKVPFEMKIYITESPADMTAETIILSIQDYFNYQIELQKIKFSKILSTARLFLLLALFTLAVCLLVAKWVEKIQSGFVSSTLREGIVIFGWVSMWKPLELLLFDWYPVYDRIRLYRDILKAPKQVVFENLTSVKK